MFCFSFEDYRILGTRFWTIWKTEMEMSHYSTMYVSTKFRRVFKGTPHSKVQ